VAQRIPGPGASDPETDELLWEALRWAYLLFGRADGAHREFYDAYHRLPADGSQLEELIRVWVSLGVAPSDARAYVRKQRGRLDDPGMRAVLRSHIDGFPRRLLQSMYRRPSTNSHPNEG
jgi:hypothetical protein